MLFPLLIRLHHIPLRSERRECPRTASHRGRPTQFRKINMKFSAIIALSALALSSNGFAADDHKGHEHETKGSAHAHEVKAQHGGVVAVVKDINYELVARPDGLALYVSDHGKPADLAGATAKLTLLSGSKKEEATLAPNADALQTKGTFTASPGTKVVAQVSLKGQPLQAVRFVLK